MKDNVIEAATRAIMTANEWSSFWDEHDAEQLAKAVITAIAPRIEADALEKAAKVIEDEDGEYSWAGEHRNMVLLQQHSQELAAAVRALIPATPAKERQMQDREVAGVRRAIAWLHKRAKDMNDPHATIVLNSAAFSLGVQLRRWRGEELGPVAAAEPVDGEVTPDIMAWAESIFDGHKDRNGEP